MIRKKYLIAFTLTAVFIAAASACQKADNKNTATNSSTNTNTANANSAVNTATQETPASTGNSPTDAYKAAYTARKNKDIVALKKLMSKDIIEFLTMIGQADEKKKQSLDDMLKEMCESPQSATPDSRNEKITGDKATLEYTDADGKWQVMDLVKEDGTWKLTIDKDKGPGGDGPGGEKPAANKDKK